MRFIVSIATRDYVYPHIEKMKNKNIWITLCVLFLVAGVAGSFFVLSPHEQSLVEIIQGNDVLHRFDLARTQSQTIDVEYNGFVNTVQIDENGIRIIHADCPDQVCVKMGYLSENSLPIICLPNHLVIQYASVDEETDSRRFGKSLYEY